MESSAQLRPGMRVGTQAVRLIEGAEQLGVEASAQAAARQCSDLSQGLATQAFQCAWCAATCASVSSGNASNSCAKGFAKPLDRPARASASAARLVGVQASCRTPRSTHSSRTRSTSLRLPPNRRRLFPEFHDHAGTGQKRFEDGNARGELQAPGRQTVERLRARLRTVRQVVREKRCPQHGRNVWNGAPRSGGSGVSGEA